MARSSSLPSAATPWLTGNHTIFGEVVEGQDIADKITKLPRNRQDKPNNGCGVELGEDRTSVESVEFAISRKAGESDLPPFLYRGPSAPVCKASLPKMTPVLTEIMVAA